MPRPTAHIIELDIDRIVVERRFRRDVGNVEALAASIAQLGLLQPIVVTADHSLVAGARRLHACRLLGMSKVVCCVAAAFADTWALLVAEVQENTCRKPFLPSEAVRAAEELLPLAAGAAWRRMAHRVDIAEAQKFTQSGEALSQIAILVGMSRPTLSKAMEIVETAREEPQKYEDLIQQMDRTGKVNGAYLEMRRRQGRARKPAAAASVTIQFDNNGVLNITNLRNKPKLLENLAGLIQVLEKELST